MGSEHTTKWHGEEDHEHDEVCDQERHVIPGVDSQLEDPGCHRIAQRGRLWAMFRRDPAGRIVGDVDRASGVGVEDWREFHSELGRQLSFIPQQRSA